MKNVTVTLDEQTVQWAREHAARRNMSLSRFVGELLETTMEESRAYESAMQRYLEKSPVKLKEPDQKYPQRNAIHDR